MNRLHVISIPLLVLAGCEVEVVSVGGSTSATATPPNATTPTAPMPVSHADPRHPSEVPLDDPCSCEANRTHGGWCGPCQHGHIAGLRVPSAALFDAIDPHGHDIAPEALPCPSCVDACADHALCGSCGWGFVDGQLYFTPLAWSIATGDLPRLQRERARLVASIETLDRCERCAVATMLGSRCHTCDLSFDTEEELQR